MTVLVAEQNAAIGLDIADRGYVLQQGRAVLDGTASELRSNSDLVRLYLGS